jgi:hypothetical protein
LHFRGHQYETSFAINQAIIITLQYILQSPGLLIVRSRPANLDLVQMLRRLNVLLSSPEEVVHASDDQDAAKHDHAPIHVFDSG